MEYEFNWTQDMSVGEAKIDQQHRGLLLQTNKVIDAIASGNQKDVVDETLAFFDKYINEHFSYEEEYMKKIGFPDIGKHVEQHKGFIKAYNFFKDQRDAGIPEEQLLLEFEAHIGSWWAEHIGKYDKQYYLFAEGK
jgi:hemerythrin